MSVTTEQRRQAVMTQLFERGRVFMKDMATEFDVSEATARRDLKALAEDGELELVYGGAVLPRLSDFSFQSKCRRNAEAKKVIGRLAAELVGDTDQIFLDSGTTCFQMVPYLKRRAGVSIIANSTRLSLEFELSGPNVILLGGQYRPDRMDTVGALALRTLDNLRGYTAFLGADGLSMDFGLTASDIESAHLNGCAVAQARETVLLADHSKFLSPSLCKIVEWDAISRIVTDRPPTADWAAFLDERGIDIICPAEPLEVAEGQ